MSTLITPFTEIIDAVENLNRTILQHAESNEWDAIAELTVERHKLIKNYCQADLDADVLQALKLAVESTDENVATLVAKFKQSTIRSSIDLRNAYNAVNKYRAVSSSQPHN